MASLRRGALVCLVLGSLAACARPQGTVPSPVALGAPAEPAAVATISPPAPGAALGNDARALIGRNASEVAELLGPPHLKRRDPPAELWQYRAGPCVLDLFLYAGKEGGAATVAHLEMRPDKTEATRAECLRAVRDASGGG